MESKAFEEFVIKRVDEELSKDKDYNLITTKSIEIFKNLLKIMKEDNLEILFQYEKTVSEINDIYQKKLIEIILSIN